MRVFVALILAVLGAALDWYCNSHTWWWGAIAVSLIGALVITGALRLFLTTLLQVVLSYGGVLLYDYASHAPVLQLARTVSGVMGFGTTSGLIVFAFTGILGLLCGLSGAWLGAALRRYFAAPASTTLSSRYDSTYIIR